MTDSKEEKTTKYDAGRDQRVATFRATKIIWLLLGLIEAVIVLRVVFQLIAFNAANPFATFLYDLSNIFVAPIARVTGSLTTGSMVSEISSIIAMIVYLLIAWALELTVNVLVYRPHGSDIVS